MINDENPSPIIAEMAQQRYQPTEGEAKMLGQYDQRQADLERIAGGGAAILPDPAEQENAEKTARWAAEDAAAKVMRGPGNRYQGAMPATAGPSFAGQRLQSGLDHRTKQRAELAFENGGKPETAEQLLARLSGKYGVSNSSPAPTPAPVTQPAPQQQPKPVGGLIQQAAGMMKGRTEAIDKATGYANGGKPGAEGSKIKGPGTATSDSIPATTGSGQPIRVANGERIVSVDQDKALQRIAEMLNYESVDAMFEALTGKPVGPTVKGGQIAAAGGLQPTEETLHNGAYTGDGGSIINDFKTWQAGKIAQTNAKIDAAMAPPAPLGNEGRAVPTRVTNTERHPISVPASRAAGAAILNGADSTPPMPLQTRDVVPGGYQDRGAGILAQRGNNGRLNVTNVGTEALTDPSKQIVDGSASALIDQKNSTYNPAAQLERMQRLRMTSNATDPTITDPSVQHQAVQGLAILNAGRQGATQERQAGTQNQLAQQQIEQGKALAGLQRELLDPATPQERRKVVQQTFAALHGRDDKQTNLEVVQVDELLDPKNPMMGVRKVPHTFDPRTGQSRPMLQGNQATDPVAQARAAIARGADPKAVNARLKAMGHPEVK